LGGYLTLSLSAGDEIGGGTLFPGAEACPNAPHLFELAKNLFALAVLVVSVSWLQ